MGSILIGVAWKSVVVLAVATATALMARRWSAAARHLIWTAAMLALLALPLLSLSLPAWHVKTDVWAIAPGVTFVSDVLAGAESAPDLVAKGTSGSSLPAPWRPNWGWIAALIWGAGTTFGCVRLMVALAAMWRLKSKSKKFEEDLTALAREIGIQREVEVLETPAGTMPMTFGWDRPAIFLPSDASDWSEERRRAVLLHELAHVKRADFVTQLLARLALSLYWWNPLAWTAWSQFLKMRERAADDLVLDAGTRASDYAGHLLEVARSSRVIATAAVAMAQPSQLEGRLMAILDARVNRKSPGRAAAVVIALAAIGVVAPVAAIHAQDTQALPADVDATIRVATGQKNFEMLDRVAAAFIQAKQYENAQKVLEAALTVRGEVAGEQSATYADGLMKLGNLAQMYRGRNAKGYYEQAVAFGDRPETAPALLYLGIISAQKEPVQAADYLQRAINADPKGPNVAEAMAWMGVARKIQGDPVEAESLLSRAASMDSEATPKHALVMEMFADFLKGEGRDGEAEALQAGASQIRKDHVASLSPKVTDSLTALRIGGDVRPPSVISKVDPEYSQEARATKTQGTVELSVTIGTDGKAGDITLKRGIGYGLDEKAEEAVSQWRFNPGTQGGAPVPVIATIQVNFRLL